MLTTNKRSFYNNIAYTNKYSKEGIIMSAIWKKHSFGIIFVILSIMMGLYLIFSVSNEDTYIKITVKNGDSLWSISEQHAERFGLGTAELVTLLEKENLIKGSKINSGDELIIPGSYLKVKDRVTELAFETE